MARARRSWREKLADDKGLPRVEPIDEAKSSRWGSGTVCIPAPREVDALMRQVPRGRVTTINALREELARSHEATIGCPITTGIFAWIAAHAADEAEEVGEAAAVTPYWRTLRQGGEINPKYPGGAEAVAARLSAEGVTAVRKGRKWIVPDWEDRLFRPRAGSPVQA